MDLPILHCDDDLLVIDKPAGLAVHPGPRTPDSLEQWLPSLRRGPRRDPVLLHRLDRDTSGCLALARRPPAVRRIGAMFAARQIDKLYWARLDRLPATEEGVIDMALGKVSTREDGWRMVADPAGKPASTRWRVLDARHRLVAFMPTTGRTHQIRVHAALLGCPIEGDPVYGEGRGPMRLHARSLCFNFVDAPLLTVEAPAPDWAA